MNFIPDNVSQHTNVYDVLKERGFIEQTTDDEAIRELLGKEKIKFYIGFDPTADCLHVGHFMQVIIKSLKNRALLKVIMITQNIYSKLILKHGLMAQ